MGVRFIYGRAGTGKSTYCFEEIALKIQKQEKIFMITPEQFSYTAEKKLLEAMDKKAVVQAEVLTFQRMAHRIIQETMGDKTNLSDCGKAILFHDILEKKKKQLKFLGKNEETIQTISSAITELKKHQITQKEWEKVVQNTQDIYLKSKLQDIHIVYEELQERIQKNYIDENDSLTILAQQIEQTNIFKDAIIYLDEFAGFTKQEYELIKKLALVAKQVTITLCTDSLEISKNPDNDIFYDNKQAIGQLKKMLQEEKIKIQEVICLEKKHRFRVPELEHIEKNIYQMPYEKYTKPVENIELFLANNPYSEIEQVARNIMKLVKKGMKYQDIAIITKQISNYSSFIKAIFAQYEIPVYIDEKKQLSDNILVQYILAMLDIFAKNWSYESVFAYLKTGFCDIQQEDLFVLERYCLKWGIKHNKWYQQDWKQGEEAEKLNGIRKEIIKPLLEFKEKLQGNKTTQEISKALYEFLIDNQIGIKLSKKIEELQQKEELELANTYRTSWDIILEVLDEMVLVLGNEKITFENYAKNFKIGLFNKGLGKIPASTDQVIVADVERSRTHKVEAIFIIGMNDGVFPGVHKEEGFLNDLDRQKLKEMGVQLAKGTMDKIYETNFNIYRAFTTAETKLYLSYVSSDSQGKSLRPSILIPRIKKIFPKLKEKSDVLKESEEIIGKYSTFEQLLYQIQQKSEEQEIPEIWYAIYAIYEREEGYKEKLKQAIGALSYTNQPTKLQPEDLEKIYGDTLYTSISRLEQYRSCPFSFYLKYTLNLKEPETFKIQTLDTGTWMHEVIDEFFTKVRQEEIELSQLTDSQVKKIIDIIINEKLELNKNYIFTSTKKYQLLVNRLKKVIYKSLTYILQTLTQSEFTVYANELEFKKNGTYPPIVIPLEDGKQVEITGKIDRVDIAKLGTNKYVRIIDYKSSAKNIELNEVVAGLQIQLLTYLDAIHKKEDRIPAGVLYYHLMDPILKSDKKLTKEELEERLKKQFKMNGLILADIKVVKMMDKELESGYSDKIPVYLDSNSNISSTRSSTVTKEQFEDLQKYTKKIVCQIAKEMMQGNIEIKPYYDRRKKKSACQWCKYRFICNFTPGFCQNEYFYITNEDKETILEKIKQENSCEHKGEENGIIQ